MATSRAWARAGRILLPTMRSKPSFRQTSRISSRRRKPRYSRAIFAWTWTRRRQSLIDLGMLTSRLVEMRGISKHFGPVNANTDVDLDLARGEILGLLGENGAGKTTLMNVLFGVYRADAGTISVEGKAVDIRQPADALAAGIGMVHQHFHLAPRLSVLDNLLVGLPGRGGRLDTGM